MNRTLIALPLLLAALNGCAEPADPNQGGSGSPTDGGAQILDALGPDACALVELDPDSWSPISAMYTGGSDPFFQLHSNEPGFYFSVELYTVYGDAWTGQTGTWDADCGTHGLCVWLLPDDVHPYLASAGQVDVVALSESGGSIDGPVEVIVRDLTLLPQGEGAPEECLHIEEVTLRL